MRTLITGATGFVGLAICEYLQNQGNEISALVREQSTILSKNIKQITIEDFQKDSNLVKISSSLKNINTVIHLAARAHIMHDSVNNPLEEYQKVNVQGTINLAKNAINAGVKRFVYISSVKVNGEWTVENQKFNEYQEPEPLDDYGLSKYEAERALMEVAKSSKMEIVIIRPPLVYGPGVKGNFASMIKWLRCGVPLPLGAINNRRSLVALDNLVDFIALCADPQKSPKAANQTFLISDGEDVSTTELLNRLGKELGKPARLIPIPQKLLEFGFRIIGKEVIAQRLCGNLQVDSSKARELLGWKPVVGMEEQMKKMRVESL